MRYGSRRYWRNDGIGMVDLHVVDVVLLASAAAIFAISFALFFGVDHNKYSVIYVFLYLLTVIIQMLHIVAMC